jgi:hypothetical protein
MMLRWLPEDIMVHNEDLEGYHGLPSAFFTLVLFFFLGGWVGVGGVVCIWSSACMSLSHLEWCFFIPLLPWFECTMQVIDVGCCCGGLLNLCLKFCLYYTLYALVLIFSRSHLSFQFCNALILDAVTRKALRSCSECSW